MASQKRKRPTYASVGQMKNIDMLLSRQPEHISMITGAEKKIIKPSECGKNEIKRKMLDNPKVKYAYSKDSNVIHDKTCVHVNEIKLKNLKVSKEYIPTKNQCPECRLNAYIREGGDFPNRNEYLKFFRKVNFDEKHIRKLFIQLKAKTQIVENMMIIIIDNYLWKLRIIDDEEFGLELSNGEVVVGKWLNADEAIYFIEHKNWKHMNYIAACSNIRNKFKNWYRNYKRDIYRRLRLIEHKMNIVYKNSVYYVDGDNNPEKRIIGIEELSKRDVVKIFCANNNSHYSNYERREQLEEKCKCKIIFVSVIPGPNAVDFAIGIDAYGVYIKKPGRNIFLLSADKHFTVIKRQIDSLSHGRANVKHLGMICEAN